ncbi:MAG: MlaD family protein [Actinomycetes bacterium]
MSIARGAAVGAIAAAAIVVGVLLLGSGGGYKYKVLFQTAGQLVKGDDVQIGGRRIGNIDAIALTKDNQAVVDITVDEEFAPLPASTEATVRLTSLSGVANRYIQLNPGPNNGPKLAEGATITPDKTTSVVDLDQLFNTLDAPTRQGLARFFRGQGQWYKGKSAEGNLAAYYFNPAISTSAEVFNEISSDQKILGQAVAATAKAMGAIGSRRQDLTNLISNSNSFAGAIAAENASFAQAIENLPATLRRANTTFVDLRSTLTDVTKLIDVSGPNAVPLTNLFTALRPAAANAVPVFNKLSGIIYTPGASNDLTDTMRDAPTLQKIANANSNSSFPESVKALADGQKTIEFARPYTVDLVGWMRELGQVTAFYDANGHYARFAPVFNSFKVDGSGQFEQLPGDERLSVFDSPEFDSPYSIAGFDPGKGSMNFQRCPGSASQIPSTMTWPFLTQPDGCNPNQVPPGP